jgi:hypothetical protein
MRREVSKAFLSGAALIAVAGASIAPFSTVIAHAQPKASSVSRPDGETCAALARQDFSAVQDAPTQVMDTSLVQASAERPTHCLVRGYISPQIGFELRLPVAWNGKFVELGQGGFGGAITNSRVCNNALRQGYACIVSDLGHTSTTAEEARTMSESDRAPARGQDKVWGFNNLQAEVDYGFRSAHVAALAGKALTERFYGRPVERSYFMGCSGGGRQAMVEAQRFPWDFDGIIAIDPALNWTGTYLARAWTASAVTELDGTPLFSRADIELLHEAVLAQCDAKDGLKDGVISDPRTCRVDFAPIRCSGGKSGSCLSDRQIDAARKVYAGPTNSRGEALFFPVMPGAEKGGMSFSISRQSPTGYFQFLALNPDPGPRWKLSDLNFDEDYKRLGTMEAVYASGNPDLRKFRDRGGRLIMAQGWDDSGSPLPLNTLDYYQTMARTMDGYAATQSFARLFMMPGAAHCGGGPGANAVDYLGYLDAWVTRGKAPDMLKAAHLDSDDLQDFVSWPADAARIKFTRPLYPYPLQARYKRGDPNDYRSFAPVAGE